VEEVPLRAAFLAALALTSAAGAARRERKNEGGGKGGKEEAKVSERSWGPF